MSDAPPPATPPQASPAEGAFSPAGPLPSASTGSAAGHVRVLPGGRPAGGRGRPGRWRGAAAGGRGRRTPARWRAAFFALAGVAVVVGVSWALLGNRVFVIRSVTVTGTHLLAPAQVIAAADVPLGTPLLNVDAGSVTGRVEALQDVASATVTEDWPDHLVIAVTERVPVMAVRMAGGGYDLVDPSGVIVRYAKAKPAALPLLETALAGGALRGDPSVTTAADVLAELQPWLATQVAVVSAAPAPAGPQQVTLDLRNGTTVQWGSTDNAAQKNRELAILRSGQVHDVNVSSPGTVVTS